MPEGGKFGVKRATANISKFLKKTQFDHGKGSTFTRASTRQKHQ